MHSLGKKVFITQSLPTSHITNTMQVHTMFTLVSLSKGLYAIKGQGKEVADWYVYPFLLCYSDLKPNKDNLRKEGFLLPHSLRAQCTGQGAVMVAGD